MWHETQIFSALSTIQSLFVLWFWETDTTQREINYIHTNMDKRPMVICIFFLFSSSLYPVSCRGTENSLFFWKKWLLLCESLLGALAQSETLHTTGVCCMWEEESGHRGNMYSKGNGGLQCGPFNPQRYRSSSDVTLTSSPPPHTQLCTQQKSHVHQWVILHHKAVDQ